MSPSTSYPQLQPYSSYFLSGFGAGDAQDLPWPEPGGSPPPAPPQPLVLGAWTSIYTYAEGVEALPYSLQLPFSYPVNNVRCCSLFLLPLCRCAAPFFFSSLPSPSAHLACSLARVSQSRWC
jgi:hypothetical protein